jgi:cation:H+ antiporter
MPLDGRQTEEIFLTAAQSLFAVVLLSDFEFSLKDSFWLFLLFFGQACYPLVEKQVGIDSLHVRYGFAWIYMALAMGMLAFSQRKRSNLVGLGRHFMGRKA